MPTKRERRPVSRYYILNNVLRETVGTIEYVPDPQNQHLVIVMDEGRKSGFIPTSSLVDLAKQILRDHGEK